MTIVADLSLVSDDFPLTDVARASPGASIRVEHILVGPGDGYALVVRARPPEAVEPALSASPAVSSWTALGDDAEGRFYRVELAEPFALYEAAHGLDVAPVWADVTPTGWHKRARFPSRRALSAFCTACERAGVRWGLDRLTDDATRPSTYGLTDRQRDALRTAYDVGYLDTPRRASSADVGARLGVSAASVSELVRRGQRRLVEHALVTDMKGLAD